MDRNYDILLIEDNSADVELLRWVLTEADVQCELTVVSDGQEAMSRIGQPSDPKTGKCPDLTILDLNLPRHDGLEILEAMRSSPTFCSVPVLVLTSSSSPKELEKLRSLGVVRHITKPCDLDEFLNVGKAIRQVLDELNGG